MTQNHAGTTEQLAARVASGKAAAPDLVIWPENSTDHDPLRTRSSTGPSQRGGHRHRPSGPGRRGAAGPDSQLRAALAARPRPGRRLLKRSWSRSASNPVPRPHLQVHHLPSASSRTTSPPAAGRWCSASARSGWATSSATRWASTGWSAPRSRRARTCSRADQRRRLRAGRPDSARRCSSWPWPGSGPSSTTARSWWPRHHGGQRDHRAERRLMTATGPGSGPRSTRGCRCEPRPRWPTGWAAGPRPCSAPGHRGARSGLAAGALAASAAGPMAGHPGRPHNREGGIWRAFAQPVRYAALAVGRRPSSPSPTPTWNSSAWFGLVPGLPCCRPRRPGAKRRCAAGGSAPGSCSRRIYWLTPNLGPAVLLVAIVLGFLWTAVGLAVWAFYPPAGHRCGAPRPRSQWSRACWLVAEWTQVLAGASAARGRSSGPASGSIRSSWPSPRSAASGW